MIEESLKFAYLYAVSLLKLDNKEADKFNLQIRFNNRKTNLYFGGFKNSDSINNKNTILNYNLSK